MDCVSFTKRGIWLCLPEALHLVDRAMQRGNASRADAAMCVAAIGIVVKMRAVNVAFSFRRLAEMLDLNRCNVESMARAEINLLIMLDFCVGVAATFPAEKVGNDYPSYSNESAVDWILEMSNRNKPFPCLSFPSEKTAGPANENTNASCELGNWAAWQLGNSATGQLLGNWGLRKSLSD